MAELIPVAGLERLSAVDWEGRLSAVVFTQGCRWRCAYCHNPGLLPLCPVPAGAAPAWPEVLRWLERRRGLLDAVVFSGGEPTLHEGLPEAMAQARSLGFQIGLHTGAPDPAAVQRLIPHLDWVGLDLKAPFAKYARITGRDCGDVVRESVLKLLAAGTALELRTTWHPALLGTEDLVWMAEWLHQNGARTWVLQRFRPQGCRSGTLNRHPLPDEHPRFKHPEDLHIRWR